MFLFINQLSFIHSSDLCISIFSGAVVLLLVMLIGLEYLCIVLI